MLNANDRIGGYILEEKLGQGGFGEVWRAREAARPDVPPVAVKLALQGETTREKFAQEAGLWLMASGHEHVVPIRGALVAEGYLVLVCDLIAGGSLRKRIGFRQRTVVAPLEAARLLHGILLGLEHLHAQGLYHCDLKPETVLMDGDTPRITDFGASHFLTTSIHVREVASTYWYMPPEAVGNDPVVSRQWDVWSAGVMLYELLTGSLPWDHPTMPQLVPNLIRTEPMRPIPTTIPGALRQIIHKALDKNRGTRYATVAAMRADLDATLAALTPRDGADLHAALHLTREEARRGGRFSVVVGAGQREVVLPAGQRDGEDFRIPGGGTESADGGRPGDLVIRLSVDPEPRRGRDVQFALMLCASEAAQGGRRFVPSRSGPLAVSVPPGVRDGTSIPVPGHGEPGDHGGPSGDLIVTVRVQPDPVRGADRQMTLRISRAVAARGGTQSVALGSRQVSVPIPAGATDGQRVPVAGAGDPGQHGGPPGDLTVRLQVPAGAPVPSRRAWLRAGAALAVGAGGLWLAPQLVGQGGRNGGDQPGTLPSPQPAATAKPPSAESRAVGVPAAAIRPAGTERPNPKDGAVMVWVPAGEFDMGSSDGNDDEKPVHRVRITKGFWLYKTEVTHAMYANFLAATPSHGKPHYWDSARFKAPRQPVVGVTWDDAVAYARWAGGRLPTEAEWEYAARGPQGKKYPWGNQEPTAELAVFGQDWSSGKPSPVGSLPKGESWCKALDLAGNVWEWCRDGYKPDFYARRSRIHPSNEKNDSKQVRVLRGGSWDDSAALLRGAARDRNFTDFCSRFIGFRVASLPAED